VKTTAKSTRNHPPGVAVVWVILLGAFLTILGLYFLTAAATAKARTHARDASVTADDLLASAHSEILAKLHLGFAPVSAAPRNASVTAMPGLLEIKSYHTPLNRGRATGSAAFDHSSPSPTAFTDPFAAEYDGLPANPRWIPLFSHRSFAPHLEYLTVSGTSRSTPNPHHEPYASFNINTPENPFTPGTTWITGAASDSTAIVRTPIDGKYATTSTTEDFTLAPSTTASGKPIWVQWIPILRNPAEPPSRTNPMIGRYAYWIDIENTKALLSPGLQDFRDAPQAARLLGEAGAIDGGRTHFDQDRGNSSRLLLAKLEASLPGKSSSENLPLTRNGQPGPGLAAPANHNARDAWLAPGAPATTASIIDFSFLETPKPNPASDLATGPTLLHHLTANSPPTHPWFANHKQIFPGNPEATAHVRQLATAFTTHGTEENLDPLGRPRIDLQSFQQSATTAAAIVSSPLFQRLTDPAYHRAYHPGAPEKSFLDSLAPFSANPAAALAQLLLNIAEAAKPDTTPPLIDETNGLVGARSMPYVAEISTRARSAFWLLPEADREKPATLLQTTPQGAFSYTHNGKRLHHYATHAVLDLCVGLINPNPFETEPFDGEIEFDITWQSPPPTAQITPGPYTAKLNGHFTANPEPGKDAKKLEPLGHTVNIRLGTFPVAALNDPKFATTFRISGWRIRRANGTLWHKVPVRAPGGAGALPFWRMAQPGISAGSPSDPKSLAPFHQNGHRSVGWFCADTLYAIIPNSLSVLNWENPNTTRDQDPNLARRVTEWLNLAPKTSVLERLICIDPTLGHRTGNPVKKGIFGNGDFYGMKGHPWRRDPAFSLQTFVAIDQTLPGTATIEHHDWLVAATPETTATATIRRVTNDRLSPTTIPTPIPGEAQFQLARELTGEYLTHRLVRPEETGGGVSKSLTTAYLIPSLEGPAFPHHFDPPKPPTSFPIDSATTISNVDIETLQTITEEKPAKDHIKLPDGKKGPRGFFCSAPPKRPFTATGEIGFVHSGFTLTPILVGPDEGALPTQLNAPQNGPPMRMLLDLLHVPTTGRPWNVNTAIAHDSYMAIREGGNSLVDMKKGIDPKSTPVHAVWVPAAQGFALRDTGSDAFRGKDVKHLAEKKPGQLLDPHLSPLPIARRPWDMWTSIVGGDFSRSGDSHRWGIGNAIFDYYRPAYFTWRPGNGLPASPWIDFGSHLPGRGLLLALGVDGRKDDKNENSGTLKGRYAADQNLAAIDGSLTFQLPAHFATRHSLIPVRHFPSDLALDFHQENHEAAWTRIKTALNPSLGGAHSPGDAATDKELAKEIEGTAAPGGHHAAGVFYHAPMALLTNQAGFTADAFTAYIVVETIRDNGKTNPQIERSGPGWCDPDDTILARHWSRQLIVRESKPDGTPTFRTLINDTIGR